MALGRRRSRLEKSFGGSDVGCWPVFTCQFSARDTTSVCCVNYQIRLARGVERSGFGRRGFRGGDASFLDSRPGGLYAPARSVAQSRAVSNHSAVCGPLGSGVGQLHCRGSCVAEHQAPAGNLAQRLRDRAGLPGSVRSDVLSDSDQNAFADLGELWSLLLIFRRARLWGEDVRDRRVLTRSLLVFHQLDEPLKVMLGVVRARRGFRMILN